MTGETASDRLDRHLAEGMETGPMPDPLTLGPPSDETLARVREIRMSLRTRRHP